MIWKSVPRPEQLGTYLRWLRLARQYPALRGRRLNIGPRSRVGAARDARIDIGEGFVAMHNFHAWFAGEVTIGDRVFFNESCHVVTYSGLTIGDDCLFGEKVSIHGEDHLFGPEHEGTRLAARGMKHAPIVIGANVWVGAKASILSGVTIGDDAVVAAHAVVTKDVPGRTLVGGVPARPLRSWNDQPRASRTD